MRNRFALLVLACTAALAQPANVLSVQTPPRTHGKRGAEITMRVTVSMKDGYHANSNKPLEDNLIPMRMSWETPGFETIEVVYPAPKLEKYQFSPNKVSVFTGTFEIVSRLRVTSKVSPGITGLAGKLRYQACTDRACLAPKTVDVKAAVEVH